MGEMYDQVMQFFQEINWPIMPIEGKTAIRTFFYGDSGNWPCLAQAYEDKFIFVFYSYCPINTPEEKRPIMAEYVARANYGLFLGNFELDFRDGEIRFKTSVDVEDDRLSPALLKQLVYSNVRMMDRYFPGILKVIYSDVTPAAAIAEIEGPPPEPLTLSSTTAMPLPTVQTRPDASQNSAGSGSGEYDAAAEAWLAVNAAKPAGKNGDCKS